LAAPSAGVPGAGAGPKREWAYGADYKIGPFSDLLIENAQKNNWTGIGTKDDWKTIYPEINP
jgi:hypothetical protein